MKIISKLKNNSLFTFILGIILCSGIVYASGLYNANDIKYEPNDTSWEVSTVNQAINSLYEMEKELSNIKSLGDAEASDITEGKTAVVQGNLVTGTKSSGLSGQYTLQVDGSFYTTTSEAQWGNWSWTATLLDSEGNKLGTVTAGVSRSQFYQFTGSASASKSVVIGS